MKKRYKTLFAQRILLKKSWAIGFVILLIILCFIEILNHYYNSNNTKSLIHIPVAIPIGKVFLNQQTNHQLHFSYDTKPPKYTKQKKATGKFPSL